jgi:DNA-binding transcriptional MerR regulator
VNGDIVTTIPVREFFSIGDVCELTDLKPHVLRYWESQFRFLHPAKNRSGNRVYQRREVELIMMVKDLLYVDKYTIEGARARVDEYRKNGELKSAARSSLEATTVDSIEHDLERIIAALDGVDVEESIVEESVIETHGAQEELIDGVAE